MSKRNTWGCQTWELSLPFSQAMNILAYQYLLLRLEKLFSLLFVIWGYNFTAIGQHNCDFNADFCAYTQPAEGLRWERVGSDANRVPPQDISATGRMAFVNADQVVGFEFKIFFVHSV